MATQLKKVGKIWKKVQIEDKKIEQVEKKEVKTDEKVIEDVHIRGNSQEPKKRKKRSSNDTE